MLSIVLCGFAVVVIAAIGVFKIRYSQHDHSDLRTDR